MDVATLFPTEQAAGQHRSEHSVAIGHSNLKTDANAEQSSTEMSWLQACQRPFVLTAINAVAKLLLPSAHSGSSLQQQTAAVLGDEPLLASQQLICDNLCDHE